MARIRALKHDFFRDEELCALGPWHRLLFAGLWGLTDRDGRLEDRPRRIHADVFPFDRELDVDQLLTDLDAHGFIVRYEVDGRRYIAVVAFRKHQRPHKKEQSLYPPPLEGLTRKPRKDPAEPGKNPASTDLAPTQPDGSWNGNGNGNGNKTLGSALRAVAMPSDVVLACPVKGDGPRTWDLTQAQVDAWQKAYPALDVPAVCARGYAWLLANPSRQKTPRGMPKFFVNWFASELRDLRNKPGPAERRPSPTRTADDFRREWGIKAS